jgi:hypothetical protein
VKILKKDRVSYVRAADMSQEDREFFWKYYNLGACCPFIKNEETETAWPHDFERYLTCKQTYLDKYGNTKEFEKELKKYLGWVRCV